MGTSRRLIERSPQMCCSSPPRRCFISPISSRSWVPALAIALFGFPLAFVIRKLYFNDAQVKLQREATLAAHDVPSNFAGNVDAIDLPTNNKGISIGLYTPDGTKLSGDGPDQGDRPVIDAAASRIIERENNDRFIAAVPVATNEQVIAVVRATTPTHTVEHRAHLAWVMMAALGTLILAFAGGLAIVQANRLTRPLRRVRDGATRLGHGDFGITVPHAGVAELDDLADALTSTAKRLGQAMQREQSLATDASHQLRTPMAGLRLLIESELAAPRPDPTLALNECLAVTDRLETTVKDLLRLVRQPASSEQLDVPGLFEKLRGHWHGSLARAGRRLELDAPRGDLPTLWASNAAIEQALDVLIDNALRHGRGSVRIAADRVGGGIALACTDEGTRPTEPARSHDGMGIGLDLATTLVEAEGGRLIRPQVGQPSTFVIMLATSASGRA
jgi:signal transduction histidine kinase